MRRWLLQLNMDDPPKPKRWITLSEYTTRHKAEHEKRAAIKRSSGLLRDDYRAIEASL